MIPIIKDSAIRIPKLFPHMKIFTGFFYFACKIIRMYLFECYYIVGFYVHITICVVYFCAHQNTSLKLCHEVDFSVGILFLLICGFFFCYYVSLDPSVHKAVAISVNFVNVEMFFHDTIQFMFFIFNNTYVHYIVVVIFVNVFNYI